MLNRNAAMQILLENARTFTDKNRIYALLENEQAAVNNVMIANLYKSAVEKSHIDFEDIPQSKGDITKYSGYTSMMEVITLLKDISGKSAIKIDELDIIETAINNIISYRDQFTKGFIFEKEFIILQYNTLVYACVEAVSIVIASYVDFIKRPDRVEFTILRERTRGGYLCIDNLAKFNATVKQGDYGKLLNTVINAGKEGFVGVDDIIVPAIIIGAVLLIVPIIRELIFLFYYSRMRLSDYAAQQAALLEINKANVTSSGLPAKKKTEVVKKQTEYINKLRALSDKVKVDRTSSESKVATEIKQENKTWNIDDVQTQAASADQGGFQLL